MKYPYFLFALLFNVLSANAGDIVLPAISAAIKFTNPVVASNMGFGIETNSSAGKFMYVNCNRTAVPTIAKKIILSITYYDNWNTLSSARVASVIKETPVLHTALKIYPNPASSYVIISYELKTPAPLLIEIANMRGEVVKTARINSQSGPQRLNITLADFSSGIYMVKIVANGSAETKKLVVY
jgi:hypothetical protein